MVLRRPRWSHDRPAHEDIPRKINFVNAATRGQPGSAPFKCKPKNDDHVYALCGYMCLTDLQARWCPGADSGVPGRPYRGKLPDRVAEFTVPRQHLRPGRAGPSRAGGRAGRAERAERVGRAGRTARTMARVSRRWAARRAAWDGQRGGTGSRLRMVGDAGRAARDGSRQQPARDERRGAGSAGSRTAGDGQRGTAAHSSQHAKGDAGQATRGSRTAGDGAFGGVTGEGDVARPQRDGLGGAGDEQASP
jgi:hypothetical protein